MRVLIVCSRHFYNMIPKVKEKLEQLGHLTLMPNSYEDPFMEEKFKKLTSQEYIKWKQEMMLMHEKNIEQCDAILVLNHEKNGQENYIGGATFLEIFKAFELEKKIFLLNPIPKNIFEDELRGIDPLIINGKIEKIKDVNL